MRIKKPITILLLLLALASTAYSQANELKIGCIDKEMRIRAEEIKQGLLKEGVKVKKDAMISMQSEEPAAIVMELEKDVSYKFLYVGSNKAQQVKFELYDGEDKIVAEKTIAEGKDEFIQYDFTPVTTDLYLIVLSQKWKHNSMCGSFTILEQKSARQGTGKTN